MPISRHHTGRWLYQFDRVIAGRRGLYAHRADALFTGEIAAHGAHSAAGFADVLPDFPNLEPSRIP